MIKARVPEPLSHGSPLIKLSFQMDVHHSLKLQDLDKDQFFAACPPSLIQRFDKSTVARLEVYTEGKRLAESNAVLVINLKDITTGQNIRHNRNIIEAQESAVGFFEVLNRLNMGGDENALIVFLNYCDIPFRDVMRPIFRPDIRSLWDESAGMRSLGTRNLTLFKDLHGATLDFVDRHLKKLQRHVEYGGIRGIANFLHIFLSIGRVIRTQMARVMHGFEAVRDPVSVSDWSEFRTQLDDYLIKFDQLMDVLSDHYLKRMTQEYGTEKIRSQFEPDLNAIHDLCTAMLEFRNRLESLRRSRLKLETVTGQVRTPCFFEKNVFHDTRWPRFSELQKTRLIRVENMVEAKMPE